MGDRRVAGAHVGLLAMLTEHWKAWGMEVDYHQGTASPAAEPDLVIPNLPRTRMPRRYQRFLARYPTVVNRRVTDISKRRISRNLLAPWSRHEGPVIIKTDENFGGLDELTPWANVGARAHARLYDLRVRARRKLGLPSIHNYAWVPTLGPGDYPVFESLAAVPRGVWLNPALVVEKFIPERRGELYSVRVLFCLGDVVLNRRVYSASPIIKDGGIESEPVEPTAQILSLRREIGLDYGKIDYVIHDGRVHILDVNNTPGGTSSRSINQAVSEQLAPGIHSFLGAARAQSARP